MYILLKNNTENVPSTFSKPLSSLEEAETEAKRFTSEHGKIFIAKILSSFESVSTIKQETYD
jgi:hypothetical protein